MDVKEKSREVEKPSSLLSDKKLNQKSYVREPQ